MLSKSIRCSPDNLAKLMEDIADVNVFRAEKLIVSTVKDEYGDVCEFRVKMSKSVFHALADRNAGRELNERFLDV